MGVDVGKMPVWNCSVARGSVFIWGRQLSRPGRLKPPAGPRQPDFGELSRAVAKRAPRTTGNRRLTVGYLMLMDGFYGIMASVNACDNAIVNRKSKIEIASVLPGGVIGNTRVFGTRIPGSSPGRVGR